MEKQTTSAIERAREYGIDISLLESSLKLTVEQRLRRLQDWVEFAEKLTYARRKLYPQLESDDTVRRVAENTSK